MAALLVDRWWSIPDLRVTPLRPQQYVAGSRPFCRAVSPAEASGAAHCLCISLASPAAGRGSRSRVTRTTEPDRPRSVVSTQEAGTGRPRQAPTPSGRSCLEPAAKVWPKKGGLELGPRRMAGRDSPGQIEEGTSSVTPSSGGVPCHSSLRIVPLVACGSRRRAVTPACARSAPLCGESASSGP